MATNTKFLVDKSGIQGDLARAICNQHILVKNLQSDQFRLTGLTGKRSTIGNYLLLLNLYFMAGATYECKVYV
jgi:hypothetical protein